MALTEYKLSANMDPPVDRDVMDELAHTITTLFTDGAFAVHWSAIDLAPESGISPETFKTAMQPGGLGFAPIAAAPLRQLMGAIEIIEGFELRAWSNACGRLDLILNERQLEIRVETPEPLLALAQALAALEGNPLEDDEDGEFDHLTVSSQHSARA